MDKKELSWWLLAAQVSTLAFVVNLILQSRRDHFDFVQLGLNGLAMFCMWMAWLEEHRRRKSTD